MKKIMWRFASLLLSGALLFTAACSESDPGDPQIEPEFPAAVIEAVEAGDIWTHDFTFNLDWKLEIKNDENDYFNFVDGGQIVKTISGKAGTATVTVAVKDLAEHTEAHACNIEATMGGKSQNVATLTLGQLPYELNVYLAKYTVDPLGGVQWFNDNGQLEFETEPATEIPMVWMSENGAAVYYVKVESDYDWTAKTPEWLEPFSAESVNSMGWIRISSNAYQPLNDTEFTVEFTDSNDLTAITGNGILVKIEGCADVFESTLPEDMVYNAEGQYYNPDIEIFVPYARAMLLAARDAAAGKEPKAYLLTESQEATTNGFVTANEPEWVNLTVTEPYEQDTNLADWTFNVAVEPNTGGMRVALLVVLPWDKTVEDAAELIDNNSLKAEYKEYTTVITQLEYVEPDAIEPVDGWKDWTTYNFDNTWTPDKGWEYSGEYEKSYKITYSQYTGEEIPDAKLKVNFEYTKYEIYSAAGPDAINAYYTWTPKGEEGKTDWLIFQQNQYNPAFYEIAMTGKSTIPVDQWEEEQAGYILFYTGDSVYAIVKCVYDPSFAPPVGGGDQEDEIYLEQPYQGVSLTTMGADDPEFDHSTDAGEQYRLNIVGTDYAKSIKIHVPESMCVINYAGEQSEWITYSPGQWEFSEVYELTFNPESDNATATVQFMTGSSLVATLYVTYSKEGEYEGENGPVYLEEKYPGVTLLKIQPGDDDYTMDESAGTALYRLTIQGDETKTVKINIPESIPAMTWPNVSTTGKWITYDFGDWDYEFVTSVTMTFNPTTDTADAWLNGMLGSGKMLTNIHIVYNK
ncbi:MAG: hypothetical protein J1D86_06880 [Alistipes sp.]|nr:hypothetical protein [Alistipes sp.]